MILGSHNSWSYLPPRRWWMRPIAFMAKCQRADIRTQYEQYGVRCFDLRVRFNKHGLGIVAHGIVEYCFTASKIYEDLAWLDTKGDAYVRVIHEVRSVKQYKSRRRDLFRQFCERIEDSYKNIHFWCGRELYCWGYDYHFQGDEPTCEERYASVCPPELIDDWWPWFYARTHNRYALATGTKSDIMLIDFVDIGHGQTRTPTD